MLRLHNGVLLEKWMCVRYPFVIGIVFIISVIIGMILDGILDFISNVPKKYSVVNYYRVWINNKYHIANCDLRLYEIRKGIFDRDNLSIRKIN